MRLYGTTAEYLQIQEGPKVIWAQAIFSGLIPSLHGHSQMAENPPTSDCSSLL
jgi:hypothetical protein